MTPNQITDTTYQLHNFINPFDRQDSYILLSGGYSKTLVIDKNRHSPTRYLGIKLGTTKVNMAGVHPF